MAKSRFVQNNFVSGELSPLLRGRTDINQYYQGAQTAKNVVIVPQGGMRRRPGTEYLQDVPPIVTRYTSAPTMPRGGTGATINDGDDATTSTTTTGISTLNPYVVAQYDFGAGLLKAHEYIDVRRISLSTGSSTEFKVQSSPNATTWNDIATVPLIGTNPQDFRFTIPYGLSDRYYRLARVGTTDLGAATVTLGEFNVWEATTSPGTNSEAKLIDFSVETDRNYLLSISDQNIRIYKTPNTHVADVKVPFTSAQVPTVRDTQVENVMLLFHEDVAPQRLINLGTDADWTLDEAPFVNVPQFDYDDSLSPTPVDEVQVMVLGGGSLQIGDTFQVDIEGVLSKSITFAGDTSADQQSSTVFNIQKNLQEMPVFGETGVAVARTGALSYTITISGESTKDFELFSGYFTKGDASNTVTFTKSASGSPRKEDVWSSTRGYPKTACFYEGRLVLGGTKSKTQSLFFSKSGSFFDFDIDDGDDDEAIFATISSRKLNEIIDVFPGRNLQVFTSGSEFAITSKPTTPSSIAITPQTSHGASYLEAIDVDGSTIFVDRHGKAVLDFVYSFNEDAYTTNDKSILASHLIKQPVDMAILKGTASEDANWVFIVNDDGSVAVLNTLREQDINGFTNWSTSGEVKSVAVVDDELYMIVKRTLDGTEEYLIERWSFDFLTDMGTTVNPGPTDTIISGLPVELDDVEVQVIADGIVLPPRTATFSGTSSQITLTSEETGYTELEIGLPFEVEVKGMPLNTNIGSGENQMRIKRITRMNLRVYNTYGVYVEGVPVPIREFGPAATSPLNTSPLAKTGIIEDVLSKIGWTRDEMPAITVPDPTPFHIQMIEYEVESS
ncbi:MAG: hypothetical protein VW879_00935 [Opitutae bacterium]